MELICTMCWTLLRFPLTKYKLWSVVKGDKTCSHEPLHAGIQEQTCIKISVLTVICLEQGCVFDFQCFSVFITVSKMTYFLFFPVAFLVYVQYITLNN